MDTAIKSLSALLCHLIFFAVSVGMPRTYEPEFNMRIISVNDGLPQQTVTSIAEDGFGFIWLGTFDGLCRYDGNSFRTFHHIPDDKTSIGNNRVLSIIVDTGQKIWIGTEGTDGLNRYDYETECFHNFHTPGIRDIRALCEAPDSSLWIGAATGLFKVRNTADPYLDIMQIYDRLLDKRQIRTLVSDSEKFIWMIAGNRILSIDYKTMEIRHWPFPGKERIESIYIDSRHNIFVISQSNIYIKEQKDDSFRNIAVSSGREIFEGIRPLRSIIETSGGKYLVGSINKGTVMLYPDDTGPFSCKAMDSNDFFRNNVLRLLYKDSMGNIWIGSGFNGAAHINTMSKHFRKSDMGNAKYNSTIKSIFYDSDGNLWTAGILYGISAEWASGQKTTWTGIDKNQEFNDIMEDRNGNIWICGGKSIYVYHDGFLSDLCNFDWMPADFYSNIGHMNAVCEDAYGGIWIGGIGKLMRIGHPFDDKPDIRYYDDTYTKDIFCMYCEPGNTGIWFGSRSRGLYLVSSDKSGNIIKASRILEYGDKIKSKHIWCICGSGNAGEVWVGTDAGLNKVTVSESDTVITDISVSAKTSYGKILAITRDLQGDLWLNTSQGLLRYSPESGKYNEYYHKDGLCSNTMTEAACMDSEGNVYIGTINGINVFFPADINDDYRTAKPVITGLKVNNIPIKANGEDGILDKGIENTSGIMLGHKASSFSLSFVAPYFHNNDKVRYRYIMEGADKYWTDISWPQHEATYNRLSPGHYTFRIKAANPDGIWDPHAAALDIIIKPAPWNTWWAYLLYAAAASGIIAAILRYWILQNKFKNEAFIEHLHREHEKILNEMKLRFHTNISHEIKTSLMLIQSPLEELDTNCIASEKEKTRIDIIRRNVDWLSSLVHQFLDLQKVENEAMPLYVALDDAAAMTVEVYSRFRSIAELKHINFLIECEPSSIPGWFDRDKLMKIISNLISNALKFTPEEGTVSIVAYRTGSELVIVVEDSGNGIETSNLDKIFDRFWQNSEDGNSGSGVGLALVKSLARLHRGKIEVSSKIKEGSTFTLTIPCTRDAYKDLLVAPQPEKQIPSTTIPENKPLILIIDDNDDIREYLGLNIGNTYGVIYAKDAESGIRMAVRHIPDLIILDIMLPDYNGYTVCSQIKKNSITCHIPIIILSAKGEKEDITRGYECGAQDYLIKPFSGKLLLKKIDNIIRYRGNGSRQPSDSPTDKSEDILVTKVREIIEKNYDNPELRINDVCDMLAMSHTQFYRKLKAVCDKSFSDMLIEYRMEKAGKMILESECNVSEVMFSVGISSNSYFTKVFKEYYGITPSEMLKKRK